MWAVTSYFNPMGYRRRLANYRAFRRNLNLPLVTVELAYGPEFELGEGDAEVLVQLRGGDVLWQKERLLNLALRHVPPGCGKVAWLDSDVIFTADDWAERTERLLDRFMLVQPFRNVYYASRDWTVGDLSAVAAEFSNTARPSAASVVASGIPAAICLADRPGGAKGDISNGFAWAARRDLLDAHGFYDACIIGAGVRAMVSAAYGCFDNVMRLHFMNDPQRSHYLDWAQRFHALIRSEIAFVDCALLHLWHGEIENRRYGQRYEEFRPFDFDPFVDIAIGDHGAWRWNSAKPDMHRHVYDYFVSRREDG